MKIEKELEQILNEQITHEFEAAYTYLGLSTALNDAGFPGFSHWMRKQYEEELTHAMKIIDYVQERGGSVKFQSFECPNFTLKCPCEAFKAAYDHEIKNTKYIHAAYALALKINDYPTQTFLQWFINEQVEEEANCQNYLQQIERAATKQCLCSMMALDHQAGKR